MSGDLVRLVPTDDDPDTFLPAPRSRERRANGKLTPWQQSDLMRELALGEKSRSDLAREFGVSHQYVTRFARQYERPIAKARANIEDKFAHMWIADKVARLALRQVLVAARQRLPNRTAEDDRTIAQLLKDAAEELGQLPPRTQIQTAQVIHTVEGFNNAELDYLMGATTTPPEDYIEHPDRPGQFYSAHALQAEGYEVVVKKAGDH
jgi:hypothetical protein